MKREGSFTIETSLVMAVVLGVILVILQLGFYLHDRCVLAGAAYEAAVWGAHDARNRGNVQGVTLTDAAEQFITGRTIWCDAVEADGTGTETESTVTVVGRGSLWRIPVLSRLLHRDRMEITGRQTCPSPDREKIIRMTRELEGRLRREDQ